MEMMMEILGERPEKGRIYSKSKGLSQKLRMEPFIQGNSDRDYICGNCGHLLAKSVNSEQVEGIAFECPRCGSYNMKR
jgi:DNA-directed RNA polymerase subunit RPC12/RpoP